MLAHILSIIGYTGATLLVQGSSHFLVNKAHYDTITYDREQPLVALGISSMLIQGAILTYAFTRFMPNDGSLKSALSLAWMFGAFLLSYMALADAGKYPVPSISSWIWTETWVAAIQFTLIGAVLWAAHHFAGSLASI